MSPAPYAKGRKGEKRPTDASDSHLLFPVIVITGISDMNEIKDLRSAPSVRGVSGSLLGRFSAKTVDPMGRSGFLGRSSREIALALFHTVKYVSKANGVRRRGVTA